MIRLHALISRFINILLFNLLIDECYNFLWNIRWEQMISWQYKVMCKMDLSFVVVYKDLKLDL